MSGAMGGAMSGAMGGAMTGVMAGLEPGVALAAAAGLVVGAVLLWGPSAPTPRDLRSLLRRDVSGAPGRPGRDPAGRPGHMGPEHDLPPTTVEEVASAMVLLAVALQSGCGVVEAIEHVASVGGDAAARQLGVVAAALRWGVGDDQAWSVVDPAWSRTALALRLAARSGVAPATMLVDGAEDLRSGRLAAVDAAAGRVAVRLVLPLGAAFLPAFILTTVVPVVLALTRQVLAP
jgi:hypothetical protein